MLTKRQKQILHRAIDSAREQGSAKYVDEYGLPVDVVAFVAMYESIPLEFIAQWEGPVDEATYNHKEKWGSGHYAYRLDPYLAGDVRVSSQEYDNTTIGFYRPAADDPILISLQKIWDMSRVNRSAAYRTQQLLSLKHTMHALVDKLPTCD